MQLMVQFFLVSRNLNISCYLRAVNVAEKNLNDWLSVTNCNLLVAIALPI